MEQSGGESANRLAAELDLLHAVRANDCVAAKLALSEGADPNAMSFSAESFLMLAAKESRWQLCRLLAEHGADCNETYGKLQRSLLHRAVITQNYGFAVMLLTAGAKVDVRDRNGSTPLHYAARSNQEYLLRRILKAGADAQATDGQARTPRDVASMKGHAYVAEILEKYEAC